jgi:hypothetical protein
MSQRRSGLLSGLVVGFIAMLLTAAGVGAALFYGARLPFEVRWAGDGLALPAAGSLLAGLAIGLSVRAVRPRSLLLPLLSALYACAALALGFVAFSTMTMLTSGFPTADRFLVANAAQLLWGLLSGSWQFGLMGGVAAVPAFLLPLMRAVRLRRVRSSRHTRHRKEGPAREEAQPESEPEYRAPFEPAQPSRQAAAPAATMNFFAPRRPGED